MKYLFLYFHTNTPSSRVTGMLCIVVVYCPLLIRYTTLFQPSYYFLQLSHLAGIMIYCIILTRQSINEHAALFHYRNSENRNYMHFLTFPVVTVIIY